MFTTRRLIQQTMINAQKMGNKIPLSTSIFNLFPQRSFAKGPIKLKKYDPLKATSQTLKSDNSGVYTPKNEKVFQLENGYYLLFYHRPEWWRMTALYLKFLIPMGVLFYLIKKNPFYLSFPALLPAMVVGLLALGVQLVKYSRVTNMLVHQVLLDPTGTELTFIYQNQFFRRLRNDKPEQSLMMNQLNDPPQGEMYKPLSGDLFPNTYPVNKQDFRSNGFSYFYRKYYLTQRLFFSFSKQPQYCNYEIMVNAFNQNIIDMSQADISFIKTSDTERKDFENFMMQQDKGSQHQKDLISDKIFELQKLERELIWQKHKSKVDKMYSNLSQDRGNTGPTKVKI